LHEPDVPANCFMMDDGAARVRIDIDQLEALSRRAAARSESPEVRDIFPVPRKQSDPEGGIPSGSLEVTWEVLELIQRALVSLS
jgi:hypothetical protein